MSSAMKKYGMGQSSTGSDSAGGSPMVSPSIASKSSELWNTAQSDVDPHVNEHNIINDTE